MILNKHTNVSNLVRFQRGSIPLGCGRSSFDLPSRCLLGCCVIANFGNIDDTLFGSTLLDLGVITQRKRFILIV